MAILLVSIGLLVVSLTQESYCSPNGCGDATAAFILGTIGFLEGGATLCWLANPLLLVAWITIKKRLRLSFACSVLATGIGLSLCFLILLLRMRPATKKKLQVMPPAIGYGLQAWG